MPKRSAPVRVTTRRLSEDQHVDRLMVLGFVISDRFAHELAPIYKPEFVSTPFVRTVVDWCLKYHAKYGKAPGLHIQDIYDDHVREGSLADDEAEAIGAFLASISEEYERSSLFNVDYALDKSLRAFKASSLLRMFSEGKAALLNGNVEAAESVVDKHSLTSITTSSQGDDVSYTVDNVREAFLEVENPLFRFKGALGELLNAHLVRDSFISVMGPEKRGKSWWLMEFAHRAFMARCNVAFFSVGDMSKNQLIRRLACRIAGKPISAFDEERGIISPVMDCRLNQNNTCHEPERSCDGCSVVREVDGVAKQFPFESSDVPAEYKPCSVCRGLSHSKWRGAVWYERNRKLNRLEWREAWRAAKMVLNRTHGKRFTISTHPNSTMSVKGISNILDHWEVRNNFIPDVVVIDYADILAPEEGKNEYRHQQNETWKALRRLSQERHNLVITATQSDADSYNTNTLSMRNFSEDKRKYSHVTGMLTLNQTPEEKVLRIMRLGWLLLREGEFDARRTVTVVQNLTVGNPCVDSF